MKLLVKKIIESKTINNGDRILVGLSGGADSVALLHALCSIRDKMNLEVQAMHLNHMLRGEDADADEKFSGELCRSLGVRFHSFRIDVEASRRKGETFEEAGRRIRFKKFDEVREKENLQKIALAHHEDDQAETFLIRLLRGSGVKGLGAIRPIRDDGVIRPLLYSTRREIEDYLAECNQDYRTDKTNLESKYKRNKIRLELIPLLKKEYNPGLVDVLARTSALLSRDDEYLDSLANLEYTKIMDKQKIEVSALDKLHDAVLSRMVMMVLQRNYGFTKDVSSSEVESIISVIRSRQNASYDFKSRLVISKEYDYIYINKTDQGITDKKKRLPESWIVNDNVISKENESDDEIYIPVSEIEGELVLRTRAEGDRFSPVGMKGKSKKLKDFFIDQKIPRSERDNVMLLCDDKRIYWVIGYRKAHIEGSSPYLHVKVENVQRI